MIQDLGDFLETNLGLAVELQSPTTLRAFSVPGGTVVHTVEFGAYEQNAHGDITDPNADTPPWTIVSRLWTDT